ncbi:MAG: saccharopine dehydrogenase NADP-binding domain-containing protein [Bacteroidia bacterium]|jgi:saccharopine dehydrogenase-like NADP-dependent oxidoreductase|nr:saccharopine dehydrogenase NADP-binding domain-containing protein [Bacteroidia bacterium]MCO5252761.1 saccharopine dehydrogenase NADP-binding domain-containing protein [Bacteroidota bacterium]MCZ2130881.1 saccharopine dehydrogenase NADP-binding domain-containing protein [Bacteroidia bacterium]
MEQSILILGAGRSSGSLITYLGQWTSSNNIKLTVADLDELEAKRKSAAYPHIKTVQLDIHDSEQFEALIVDSTVVVSMLPHALHPKVAKLCIKHSKHLATASYAKREIMAFDKKAKENGLSFLFELGADPGIDHLSACKIINDIKEKGGTITSFKSFTGALMSPKNENDNPWNYKFTWNPKNVVTAGQGEMARYRVSELTYYVPYTRLFNKLWHINFPKLGAYEAYANRNSLDYTKHYRIEGVPTIIRGTLRRTGFCEAWNALILLGITENTTKITIPKNYSYKDFFLKFTDSHNTFSNRKAFEGLIGTPISKPTWEKIKYLKLNSNKIIGAGTYTPADVLEKLLLERWQLNPKDQDLLVMYHQIDYTLNESTHTITSCMSLKGKDAAHTAISDTVGLPLAMGVKLLLNGQIPKKGVILPVIPEIYIPILNELKEYGIVFKETVE